MPNVFMKKPNKIIIIHPEGNINDNPNLSGIVELLRENGYLVDILSSKRDIPQVKPCEGSRLILYTWYLYHGYIKVLSDIRFNRILVAVSKLFSSLLPGGDLIIGIDRNGIIAAAALSIILNRPYALISYEIFFREEAGEKFKEIEIEACKGIRFAVCQDKVRSCHLSRENRIDPEKIITIPVAGRGRKTGSSSIELRLKLSIPADKKIALVAGSIARWSMIDELIKSTAIWPDDWVLLIHYRYGWTPEIAEIIEKNNIKKVFVSKELYPTFAELEILMNTVDLGIALYKSIPGSISLNNNIKYIGLSSGKIATYLQHGLPIIINEIGPMSDLVRKYKIGYVVQDTDEISSRLKTFNAADYQVNCQIFFNKYLDLDYTIQPLLDKIRDTVQQNFP